MALKGSQDAGPGKATRSIGLTGNIGSGKSTVARLLEERGAAVIDSDALAREATADPQVLERIGEELGAHFVAGGKLDRERMAKLVFGDAQARRKLEGIIHPWVGARSRRLQAQLLAGHEPPPLIVYDIPLLFESGLENGFDAIVVVSAPAEVRAARLTARRGLGEAEFRARDATQWPLERKEAQADYVLDNSGDLGSLEEQVAALWQKLRAAGSTRGGSTGGGSGSDSTAG